MTCISLFCHPSIHPSAMHPTSLFCCHPLLIHPIVTFVFIPPHASTLYLSDPSNYIFSHLYTHLSSSSVCIYPSILPFNRLPIPSIYPTNIHLSVTPPYFFPFIYLANQLISHFPIHPFTHPSNQPTKQHLPTYWSMHPCNKCLLIHSSIAPFIHTSVCPQTCPPLPLFSIPWAGLGKNYTTLMGRPDRVPENYLCSYMGPHIPGPLRD